MSRWTRRLLAMLSSATVLAVGLGVVQMLGTAASSAEPPQVIAQGADSGMAPERYIVELDDPPLARYRGGIAKLAPTAVRAGGDRRRRLGLEEPIALGDDLLDLLQRLAELVDHRLVDERLGKLAETQRFKSDSPKDADLPVPGGRYRKPGEDGGE